MDTERLAEAARLAPLKEELPTAKRAFAEDLRKIFLNLNVSVRRYASRVHIDASTMTRYLNGQRIPPWDFVARLIADNRDMGAPLTADAEEALRGLHHEAEKVNRRGEEKQSLQEQLTEADEETRRIKIRERALEEALRDRQRRLNDAETRCRTLQAAIKGQRQALQAELETWTGRYARLRNECTDLQEEVLYLQEVLAATRAELIAAEQLCHTLEAQLDAVQDQKDAALGTPALVAVLDETDRNASVSDLVAVVSNLESRTHQAMASELVRSVSQSRAVEEVTELISALERSGLRKHAEAALPALVVMRHAGDTSALAMHLHAAGLEGYVEILIRASVELHDPHNIATLVRSLHANGLSEHAACLLSAACIVRPVTDVSALLTWLLGTDSETAVASALAATACRRSVPDIMTLSHDLHEAGLHHLLQQLTSAVGAHRSAADVAQLIELLDRSGMVLSCEAVLAVTLTRRAEHLIALMYALQATNRHEAANSILRHMITTRPPADIASLVSDLHTSGRHQQAANAMITALPAVPSSHLPDLFRDLDMMYPGSKILLQNAVKTGSPRETADIIGSLASAGLRDKAEFAFEYSLSTRPTGHAERTLRILRNTQPAYFEVPSLLERVDSCTAAAVRTLLLALVDAGLVQELDAVLKVIAERGAAETVKLFKQLLMPGDLSRLSDVVSGRLIAAVVGTRNLAEQAALVVALDAAELAGCSRALALAAGNRFGRPFLKELEKERTKHEQKVLSRRFWKKNPSPPS